MNEVWAVGAGPATAAAGGEVLAVPQPLQEPWAERAAIMVMDGGLPREEASAWPGRSARQGSGHIHRHAMLGKSHVAPGTPSRRFWGRRSSEPRRSCGIDDSHDQRNLSEGPGTVSKVWPWIAVAS